ncbi:MAG: peptidylprolyl isomerase [Oscillospiraceae bacterium]|nr:peptidylprolyl isomerase [Oscillospiraceae bacterium]
MRRTGAMMPRRKSKMARVLTLCAIFTLLGSLLFSGLYAMMSGYSSVIDANEIEMIQLNPPKSGDQTAVVHTTAGDMTFLLYPEQCPKTVENFIALAQNGDYNDSFVFLVEPDVFFEAGAPNADGSLNEGDADKPSERIPRELSAKLWPLRGALCAATTSADAGFWKTLFGKQEYFTGSRFLVVDTVEMTEELQQGMRENQQLSAVADAFIEKGGIPNFSMQMTVFGQLIDGFDILDAITGAEVTGEHGETRPKEEIRVKSVETSSIP